MFKNNLTLIFRNFKKFKGTFFINLIGLSTGLACALLIYLWVNDELLVDKFHEHDERLYQVMKIVPDGDGNVHVSENTPGLLAEALLTEMPEVEETAITFGGGGGNKGIISVDDAYFKANEMFATKEFFSVFSYKLIEGDKKQVLKDKHAVLLSDELALKLFNTTENIIGKTINWDKGEYSGPFVVSGIFEKTTQHSSFQFDLLFSYGLYFDKHAEDLQNWGSNNPQTYLILKKGTDVDAFSNKIKGFLKEKYRAVKGDEFLEYVGTLFVQQYSDKYLYNKFENGKQAGGRIEYVKLFSIIGLFILAVACINFMNLSTARASRRMKEIGIKKAIGANRKSLIFQFLGESVLLSFVSLFLALTLVLLLLPAFNDITGKQLNLQLDINSVLAILGITLATGLLSGSYPALYLSRFSPVIVLKGKMHTSTGEVWARKGLVVFQFMISVILIVSVFVVYKQISFIQSKNLGYNKENIIKIASEGKLRESQETFLQELKQLPGVADASSMGGNLTGAHGGTFGLDWEGKNPSENVDFQILYVNYGLLELLGIEMSGGRTYSKDFGDENSNVIFNEAAIDAMGLKDPVGKSIKVKGKDYQIVGVTKDFHFESLYEKVKPLFFLLSPNQENILIKIKAGMEKETIEQIGHFYENFNQGLPFEYSFLDEEYQVLYAAEQRVAVLSKYFATVAIIISSLGLFGLVSFTAERRRKEIGIRKLLGSGEFGIVWLLLEDFTRIVLTSVIVALPLSYWLTQNWLNNFAFSIDMEWWYFVGAGFLTLLIAWMTMGTQAFRAARANPVQFLKEE